MERERGCVTERGCTNGIRVGRALVLMLGLLLLWAVPAAMAQEEFIPGCESGTRRFYWQLDPQGNDNCAVLKAEGWFTPDGRLAFHTARVPLPPPGDICMSYSVINLVGARWPVATADNTLTPRLKDLLSWPEESPGPGPGDVPDPVDAISTVNWGDYGQSSYRSTSLSFHWDNNGPAGLGGKWTNGRWRIYANINGDGDGNATLPYIQTWNHWHPVDVNGDNASDDVGLDEAEPIYLYGTDNSTWTLYNYQDDGENSTHFGYTGTWWFTRVELQEKYRTRCAYFPEDGALIREDTPPVISCEAAEYAYDVTLSTVAMITTAGAPYDRQTKVECYTGGPDEGRVKTKTLYRGGVLGGPDVLIGKWGYRYYDSESEDAGRIRFIFSQAAMARTAAHGYAWDDEELSDEILAMYADQTIDYNESGQVSKITRGVFAGGTGTGFETLYSYDNSTYKVTNTDTIDYNMWINCRQDDTRDSNGAGTVIKYWCNVGNQLLHKRVSVYKDGNNHADYDYHYVYDNAGKLLLAYTPGSFTGFSPQEDGSFTSGSGANALVRHFDYWDSEHGLSGTYSDGDFDYNFRLDSTVNFNPASNSLWSGLPDEIDNGSGLSVKWTGKIEADSGGTYTLRMKLGQGHTAELWVGSQVGYFPDDDNIEVTLSAGQRYPITIYWESGSADNEVILQWVTPGGGSYAAVPSTELYSHRENFLYETSFSYDGAEAHKNLVAMFTYLSGSPRVDCAGNERSGIPTEVKRYVDDNESYYESTSFAYTGGFYDANATPVYRTMTVDLGGGKTLNWYEYYNADALLILTRDPDNCVTVTDSVLEDTLQVVTYCSIRDADTSDLSGTQNNYSSLPSAWQTTNASPKKLTTTYSWDYYEDEEAWEVVERTEPDGISFCRERDNVTLTFLGTSYTKLTKWTESIEPSDNGVLLLPRTIIYEVPGGPVLSSRTVDSDNGIRRRTDHFHTSIGLLEKTRTYFADPDNQPYGGGAASDYSETTYTYDSQRRVYCKEDAEGAKWYYTYGGKVDGGDCYYENRVYWSSWDPATSNWWVVEGTWTDYAGRTVRTWKDKDEFAGTPTGGETLDGNFNRTVMTYDWRGLLQKRRVYYDIAASGFAETEYRAYDYQNRLLRTKDPGGNITATVFDRAGRATSSWLGTDDEGATVTDPDCGASNLKMVSRTLYEEDDGIPRTHVTRVVQLASSSSTEVFTGTDYEYDSAGRRIWTKPDVGPWSKVVLDDAGRVKESYTIKNGDNDCELALTTTVHDGIGRTVATRAWECVDGDNTSNYLETTYDYDPAGMQCKVTPPGKAFTKTLFDAAGRTTGTYLCISEGASGSPFDVDGDNVVEQTNTTYNKVGQPILVAALMRKHGDTATTGPLTTSNAVYSATVTWYDHLNRLVCQVDYGRDQGHYVYDEDGALVDSDPEDGIPDVAQNTPPEPNTSDDYIVYKQWWGKIGRLAETYDNRNKKTYSCFDNMERKTQFVENYCAGGTYWDTVFVDPKPRLADNNRLTVWEYDNGSHVTKMTAVDPNNDGNISDNQETLYTYGGDDGECPVKRKDLLVKVQYPDGDCVTFTYYADGSLASRTDQRGTKTIYGRDYAGRTIYEKVDVFSGDTDNTVKWNSTSYTDAGLVEKVTSQGTGASSADHTTDVKNQVTYTYNGFLQVTQEKQAVAGVAGAGTPSVQRSFGSVSEACRQESTTYPNGRVIDHAYGADDSIDDNLCRVRDLKCDGTSIVQYAHLGAGMMVTKDYATPGMGLDYTGTSNDYAGRDGLFRTAQQKWTDLGTSTDLFNIAMGYDRNSNRTHDERTVYGNCSKYFTYDDLDRLATDTIGVLNSTQTGMETGGTVASRDYTMDQLGNQLGIDTQDTSDYFTGAFNAVNEFDNSAGSRKVKGTAARRAKFYDSFDGMRIVDNQIYTCPGANDVWEVDNVAGVFKFTTVADDTIDNETIAFVVTGQHEGPVNIDTSLKFPAGTSSGYAGIVFGYKDSGNYHMLVYEVGVGRRLYRIDNGAKALVASITMTVDDNVTYAVGTGMRRECVTATNSEFLQGVPQGKVGLVSSVDNVTFDHLRLYDTSTPIDILGRWTYFGDNVTVQNYDGSNRLCFNGIVTHTPVLSKSVRLDKFQVDFNARRLGDGTTNIYLAFNAKDHDDFNIVNIPHRSSATVPAGYAYTDGGAADSVSGSTNIAYAVGRGDNDTLYVRVQNDGTYVKVYEGTSAAALEDACTNDHWCFRSSNFTTDGGRLGFRAAAYTMYLDNVVIRSHNGAAWVAEFEEYFEVDGSGYASETPAHDAAGNLTYDGLYRYTYDAWNRLTGVKRGYRDATGELTSGSTIGTITYDGVGRRITKTVTASGDWDQVYRFYYDGQSLIETRDGSDDVLKQHIWGTQYVDELVQVTTNDDPSDGAEDTCETTYYALQDANYNVLGVVDSSGDLAERYEQTPYGERSVFTSAGSNDTTCKSRVLTSRPVTADGAAAAYGICDVGFQGKLFDKEWGGIGRFGGRYYHPVLARWLQRDYKGGYVDGSNLYGMERSNPVTGLDPKGQSLWISPKDPNADRLKKLVNILAPKATFDENGFVQLKEQDATTTTEKLVFETAKPYKGKKPVEIKTGTEFLAHWKGDPRVDVSFTQTSRLLFSKMDDPGPYPVVEERTFLVNDREQAVALGHELIHIYYRYFHHRGYGTRVQNLHIFAEEDEKAPNGKRLYLCKLEGRPTFREEFFDVGCDWVRTNTPTHRGRLVYTDMSYDGTFTQNRIAKDLGLKWRRAAYAGPKIIWRKDITDDTRYSINRKFVSRGE